MRKRDIVAALVGAGTAIVLAGGVAWAAIPGDGGVYSACMLKNVGTVRLIDKSLPPGNLMSKCTALEVEISWNQQGQRGLQGIQGTAGQNGSDGDDGESPSVAQLAVGDTNCPAGGAAITDDAGSTAYVCSGQAGQDGADGDPFAGTFASPNGEYTLSVTDAGVTISRGANLQIRLAGDEIFMRGNHLEMRGDDVVAIRAGNTATVEGSLFLRLRGGAGAELKTAGVATVEGSIVQVKGGAACLPAARLNDPVSAPGGIGQITGGAPTVCIG